MVMFGEFEITNELDASSVIALLATLFRTGFQDVIETSESTFDKTIIKSPPLDQDEVFTSQFVYYEFTKPLEEIVLVPDDDFYELTKPEVDEIFSIEAIQDFHITKPLISEVIAEDTSLLETANAYALDYFRQDYSEGLIYDTTLGFYWELTKPFTEEQFATETTFEFNVTLSKEDELITSQTVDYELTKPLSHSVITSESVTIARVKAIADSIKAFSIKFTDYDQEIYILDSEPNENDYFLDDYVEYVNIPIFDIETQKPFYETLNISNADVYSPELTKPFTEIMTTTTTTFEFEIGKNILDDVAATEDRFFTDPENSDIYVEAQNDPDSDNAAGYFAQYYVEDINVPLLEKSITKPLLDSINSIEGGLVALNPYATVHFFDGYFEEDYIEGSRAIS